MPMDFNPQACSKRDVASVFGEPLTKIDKWTRQGCPCKPTGTGPRSPLVFNIPQVWRWLYVKRCYEQGGETCGQVAEKQVEIWNLELRLEVGDREAARILGPV